MKAPHAPPMPEPIGQATTTRCEICRHQAWAAQWIEDALSATREAGHPRPSIPVLHAAIAGYWQENGERYDLPNPPTLSQIDGHVRKHGHAKGWFLWD